MTKSVVALIARLQPLVQSMQFPLFSSRPFLILFIDSFTLGRTGSPLLFKGFSLVVVHGLLTAVTSVVAEHGLEAHELQ